MWTKMTLLFWLAWIYFTYYFTWYGVHSTVWKCITSHLILNVRKRNFVACVHRQDKTSQAWLQRQLCNLSNQITLSTFNPPQQRTLLPWTFQVKYQTAIQCGNLMVRWTKHIFRQNSPSVYFVLWINIYSTLHQSPHFDDIPDCRRLSQSLLQFFIQRNGGHFRTKLALWGHRTHTRLCDKVVNTNQLMVTIKMKRRTSKKRLAWKTLATRLTATAPSC